MSIPYNKLSKDDIKNIINLYFDKNNIGINLKEIARDNGYSERAFSRVLRENNISTQRKNRYTLNENYFENIDTEQKAYLLGLLYADGFVGDDKYNNIVISLTIGDIAILQEFSKEIEFTGDIRIRESNGGFSNGTPGAVLNFSSVKMAKDLRALGLYPGKSQTMKSVPCLDSDLMRHFVRGYFDGDGSIHTSDYHENDRGILRHRIRHVFGMIGTVDFIDDITKNIPVKLTRQSCKSFNMIYCVCNVNSRLIKIYDYLYKDATIYLDRKFNKWNSIIGAIEEKSSKEKLGELLEG